jgi:two-component system, cell cycle response regulator CpdR
MKSLSILVTDDEEGIRTVLVQWLQALGHRVASASNGCEAARVLDQQRFDLVITDIVMPDGDGFDVIAKLKQTHPTTRILAVSGGGKYLPGSEGLRMAKGLGVDAVLMKPFDCQQILAAINQAIVDERAATA